MDFKQEVQDNNHQIGVARDRGYLKDVDEETWELIRVAGKFMISFCSDGRYSWLLVKRIVEMTQTEIPHKYCGHGGTLLLKADTPLLPADSTYTRDTVNMIHAAHTSMGYNVLVACFHGPECKAMLGSGVSIDQAFNMITEMIDELNKVMPNLIVIPMFHRDKGERLCRLYRFCVDTYRSDQEAVARAPEAVSECNNDSSSNIAESMQLLKQLYPARVTIVNQARILYT